MQLLANLQSNCPKRSLFLNFLFIKYAFFGQLANFEVVMAIQSIWKLYIPILLLDEDFFKPKMILLSTFWKFDFFNNFVRCYPLGELNPFTECLEILHLYSLDLDTTFKKFTNRLNNIFIFWTGLFYSLLNIVVNNALIKLTSCRKWHIPYVSHLLNDAIISLVYG